MHELTNLFIDLNKHRIAFTGILKRIKQLSSYFYKDFF